MGEINAEYPAPDLKSFNKKSPSIINHKNIRDWNNGDEIKSTCTKTHP